MAHEHNDIYTQAQAEGSFKCLIPYPCQLFKWQRLHPEDNMRIATIASHRLNHHNYCETTDKCWTVEQFLQKYDKSL